MGPSEPTIRFRCGGRLTDRSYSGDNRLVAPKSSYRRRSSAPRCRLILSWRWRSFQGFGCSPIKKIRELGSDREDGKKHDERSMNHEWCECIYSCFMILDSVCLFHILNPQRFMLATFLYVKIQDITAVMYSNVHTQSSLNSMNPYLMYRVMSREL